MESNNSDLDFTQEVNCTYKEEHYSVRDNGSVMKFPLPGKRLRPTDNQWTFGKLNIKTGYLEIASVRIHRIVATAFHGQPPTIEHVVDHIDTNKQNNRPKNLRWVTRLENILLNPITAKRIAIICGSVEAFLANPPEFRDKFPDPNYLWMCNVTSEEAAISLQRMLDWAKSDKIPSGGSLGEWIYNRTVSQNSYYEPTPEVPVIVISKTLNAAQRDWRIPSEFPSCPFLFTAEPITTYAESLMSGSVFCRNDIYSSVVSKSVLSNDKQALYVLTECENGIKRWALAMITFEDNLYVHTSLRTFFTQEGAEKEYCLAQGLEWTGGDSIDDYC